MSHGSIIRYECLYCGRHFKFEHTYYLSTPRCPCGETKQLRQLTTSEAKGDIFGYEQTKKKTSQAKNLETTEAGDRLGGGGPSGHPVQTGFLDEDPGGLASQGRPKVDLHRDGHGGEDRRAGDPLPLHQGGPRC